MRTATSLVLGAAALWLAGCADYGGRYYYPSEAYRYGYYGGRSWAGAYPRSWYGRNYAYRDWHWRGHRGGHGLSRHQARERGRLAEHQAHELRDQRPTPGLRRHQRREWNRLTEHQRRERREGYSRGRFDPSYYEGGHRRHKH